MIDELALFLQNSGVQSFLIAFMGFVVGLLSPALFRVYIRFVERFLSRRNSSWQVPIVGPAGSGKTALVYRLIGDSSSEPGLTLRTSKYRRPVYIRDELVDIIFTDGAGEIFDGNFNSNEDWGLPRNAELAILVVGAFGGRDRVENRSLKENSDFQQSLEFFSRSFLEVLWHSLPRLKRVIIFVNWPGTTPNNKPGLMDEDELQLDRLIKTVAEFRSIEVSIKHGSVVTGEGIPDLFADILRQAESRYRR